MSDRLPPQAIETEASLLSALLINNAVIDDALCILSPDDFYNSAHKKIFEAVISLSNNKEPVDLATIYNLLKERKQIKQIGGAEYLSKLVDQIPLAVNAEHYARIIKDKAITGTLSIPKQMKTKHR